MLTVTGLSRSFGGVYAVRDVSLSVADGEVCGVIGPNGAGKSTLFNLITGHLAADQGRISFLGQRVDRLPRTAAPGWACRSSSRRPASSAA
ncbi:ATP-binding cassette domain-containing protein [Nonomuraea thailandensis]